MEKYMKNEKSWEFKKLFVKATINDKVTEIFDISIFVLWHTYFLLISLFYFACNDIFTTFR